MVTGPGNGRGWRIGHGHLFPGLKGGTRGSDGVSAWNDFFFHLKGHVAKKRSYGLHIAAKTT